MLYQTKYQHGGDIYTEPIRFDFSVNTNPFGTPPSVLAAIKNSLSDISHYPDPYCHEAVQAISTYEHVDADSILLGNGAAELIYSFCEAAHPRSALLLSPTFSEYEAALKRHDCKIIHHTLLRQKGFLPDELLVFSIRENHPDAVFLCNPNNPTGRLMEKELLKEILNLCEQENIRLFLDECFLDFTDRSSEMKEFISEYQNLFILKAFTKSHALAGVRIGYCLSSDQELLAAMAQTAQPWNVSVIAQTAAAAAAKEEDFLNITREFLEGERKWLIGQLVDSGFLVIPSDCNFILFKGPVGLDLLLRKERIAIRNCDNFHGLSAGWYRIAVLKHENNEILIQTLHDVLNKEDLWQKTS